MNIRIVLWTLCMGVAGFLLVGSTPSITSVAILGLCTGAAVGTALGIMFGLAPRTPAAGSWVYLAPGLKFLATFGAFDLLKTHPLDQIRRDRESALRAGLIQRS